MISRHYTKSKKRKLTRIKRRAKPIVDGMARYREVSKIPLPRRQKPIARVSVRQKKRLAEYAKVKSEYLKHHQCCELAYTGSSTDYVKCHGAVEVHHRRGRVGKLLSEPAHFLPVCRSHHNWIHSNVDKAQRFGWIEQWGKTTP